MQILRGFHHPGLAPACALTIGNFDGVHRGHQAMLALLNNEARHRGVPSCVMTFEPHPRDYFAAAHRKPELAPARIATLRDKLTELARCGVDQCVVLKFDQRFSSQPPEAFIDDVLVRGLKAGLPGAESMRIRARWRSSSEMRPRESWRVMLPLMVARPVLMRSSEMSFSFTS